MNRLLGENLGLKLAALAAALLLAVWSRLDAQPAPAPTATDPPAAAAVDGGAAGIP